MNIGLLGYTSPNSWAPRMAEEYQKMGHAITMFSIEKTRDMLSPLEGEKCTKNKYRIPLSKTVRGFEAQIDLLILEHSFLRFHNDLRMPVVYYHTELYCTPTVGCACGGGAPTHLLTKEVRSVHYFRHQFGEWFDRVEHTFHHPPCAYPPFFNPGIKKDILVSFTGAPADMFDRIRDPEWEMMQKYHDKIRFHIRQWNNVISLDRDQEEPSNNEIYRDTLHRSHYKILTAQAGAYIGRMAFEAMACKTVPVLWVENDLAEEYLKNQLGFRAEGKYQNCYFFRTWKQLKELVDRLEPRPDLEQRTYDMFMNYHTYAHRAKALENQLKITTQTLWNKPRELVSEKDLKIVEVKIDPEVLI